MPRGGDRSSDPTATAAPVADRDMADTKGRDSRRNGPGGVPTPTRGGQRRGGGDGAKDGNSRAAANSLEDVMRRKGVDEAWTLLEEMQRNGTVTDKFTVSRMLMKTVGDGRCRMNPARVYRGIDLVEHFIEKQPGDVDEVLFNALLDTCCRLKDLTRVESTVQRMRDLKVQPSPVTLGILVKTYGQAGDLQKVLQVWSEMEKQRGQANAVTYGCMIDACVKCGNLAKAVEIFEGMRAEGQHKNTVLYTTLIKGHGLEKDLKTAMNLFREMPSEGVPYNTITYNSIIDACIKCGEVTTAEMLLREMTETGSSLEPDLITYSTLLKGYCHAGQLDEALNVAEMIKSQGLRCDELVYNTLMDGCVKANDITAGIGLFEEMVSAGMKPSAITHSILIRLYQRAGYEDDAAEAVAHLYLHHGIERPVSGERGSGKAAVGGRGRNWGPMPKSPGSSNPGSRSGSVAPSPLGSPQHSFGGWSESQQLQELLLGGSEMGSSAPGTPMSGSGAFGAGSSGGRGLFLPLDAMRGGVPALPLAGAPDNSPFSSHSSVSGHSCSMSYGQQSPIGMTSTTPMSHAPAPCAAPQQIPPWPFQCGSTGEGFPMHQQPQQPQQHGGYPMPQAMPSQQPSPFPMPLSPPHDAFCVTSTLPGGQPSNGLGFQMAPATSTCQILGTPGVQGQYPS
eukprot:gnl/TRDRNA2_/TRDRNA2_173013_c3_seq5.p1 gnl/TRDRNA2_/TRDRNA2_173013_c3~~gnl/TRDRNA2_/TRDRNA2_173013_c3_seq5.p1  ORF type:complete len:676 (-),score=118.62 gnl/TRDRNA2_/TRDRNA2_173013_c3_seq5:116-2143(-)